MRALLLEGEGRSRVSDDVPDPEPSSGEAIVDVRVAGVCDTDIQLARGYMGFRGVPGHEFVGVVRQSDEPLWIGKRVVADINAGCGTCRDCTEAGGHHCASRTVLGILGRSGAFAERLAIPNRCLVEVPAGVADETAVFAEPLAAALHVLDEARGLSPTEAIAGGPGDSPPGPIVILGDGKLGQLIARAVRSAGWETILVGRHEPKLALARGAEIKTLLETEAGSLAASAPLVVDATGSASGLELALKIARPRGKIILKTTVAGPITVDMAPVVIHELSIVGSRCGNMRSAVDALARANIDPSVLVEARYPLSRADEALSHAQRRGALKVLITV